MLDDDAPDDVDEESYMRLVLRLEKSEQQLIKGLMPRISEVCFIRLVLCLGKSEQQLIKGLMPRISEVCFIRLVLHLEKNEQQLIKGLMPRTGICDVCFIRLVLCSVSDPDPHKEMPPGSESAWTDVDPDPGCKKA